MASEVPHVAVAAVLGKSGEMAEGSVEVRGYDFNQGVDYPQLLQSMLTTGFQATNFALAVEEVQRMRSWRLSDEPITSDDKDEYLDPETRAQTRCTRECIRYLLQHNKVDCLVTTAGGVEEDIIKCLAPHYLGDFSLNGADLRRKGDEARMRLLLARNLLVPNKNYCLFEDWLTPLLDEMLEEQKTTGQFYSPTKMIWKMGEKLDKDPAMSNKEESILLWAFRNKIPIFCPAITDGSIGDMIYFRSFTNPGLVMDIAQDIRMINDLAVKAARTALLCFHGFHQGAKPDEAVSWGKVRIDAKPVK
ncbi:MAG: hypothetical protein SGPRY_000048, partial [Prymnesium sp.]